MCEIFSSLHPSRKCLTESTAIVLFMYVFVTWWVILYCDINFGICVRWDPGLVHQTRFLSSVKLLLCQIACSSTGVCRPALCLGASSLFGMLSKIRVTVCHPLCLKRSCLFKAPPPLLSTPSALIGQLAHTWASTPYNNNRAAVLN